jgi:hypothetical protein
MRNRLRARFTGGFRDNPFFNTDSDEPVVKPKIILAGPQHDRPYAPKPV